MVLPDCVENMSIFANKCVMSPVNALLIFDAVETEGAFTGP
jgi:hypothetical protein